MNSPQSNQVTRVIHFPIRASKLTKQERVEFKQLQKHILETIVPKDWNYLCTLTAHDFLNLPHANAYLKNVCTYKDWHALENVISYGYDFAFRNFDLNNVDNRYNLRLLYIKAILTNRPRLSLTYTTYAYED